MSKMFKTEDGWVEAPIHAWFGLDRQSYLVIPRLALQELPLEWQNKLIALLDEAADLGMVTPSYTVLRDDRAYVWKQRSYNDDNEEPEHEVTAYHPIKKDEWANYRRGKAADLCDTWKENSNDS